MSITVNVPQTSSTGPDGPICDYVLIPTSAITTQQGGLNLYQMALGGMESIAIDGTECGADLLIQFFMQGSPVGTPFPRLLRANQRELYRFDAPIDFLVISNATGSYPLPLDFGGILQGSRPPQNTSGYLLVSGLDTSVEIDSLSGIVPVVLATGQSLVSIPGAAAASTIVSDSTGSGVLGSILHTLPSEIWGVSGYCSFSTTDLTSIAAGNIISVAFLPYIQGVTSGKQLFVGSCCICLDLAAATPASGDVGSVATFQRDWPNPISSAVYFPADTQFKFGVSYANFSTFGGVHGVQVGVGAALIGS